MNDTGYYYYNNHKDDTRNESNRVIDTALQELTSVLTVRKLDEDRLDATTTVIFSKPLLHHLATAHSLQDGLVPTTSTATLIEQYSSVTPNNHRNVVMKLKSSLNFPEATSTVAKSTELHSFHLATQNYTDSGKYTTVTNDDNYYSNMTTESSYLPTGSDFSLNQQINEIVSRNILLTGMFPECVHDVSPRGCNLTLNLNHNRSTAYNISSINSSRSSNESDVYGNNVFEDYIYDLNSEESALPLNEILPVSLIYSVTLMVGVVGNLLVIAAVARDRRLRSITNLFLTSLASADLALLCLCVPVKCVAFFSFSWAFGFFLCKLVHYVQIVTMVCSVMTLTVMSIERNIAILFPLRSKRICTRRRARIVVILLWAGSVLLALPVLAGQKHHLVGERHKAYWCTKEWDKPLYGILFEAYMLVLLFLVPVVVMIVSYTTICLELYKCSKFRRQATNTLSSKKCRGYSSHRPRQETCTTTTTTSYQATCRDSMLYNRNMERMDQEKIKVIRMLIVVVVLFAVCWGPILINNLLVALDVINKLHVGHLKPLRQTIFLLQYLNSSLNPIVYGFMSRHFRRGFREAICVCCSNKRRRCREIRSRRPNNTGCFHSSEGDISTNRTGTIRLSPVTQQVQVATEKFEEYPVDSKRYGHKVWARSYKVTLDLHM